MSLTFADVQRTAQETGFPTETVEKVLRLLSLLNALSSHPFLKERLVLKGGTALNLFLFEVPRLSVDIDLNYIGASDRETMLAERPRVEQAITAVCSREGLTIKWAPDDHAGGKWRVKQWGRVKIKYELKQKQVTEYCIKKALQQISEEEYLTVLKKLADEKYASLKAEQYLVRKKKTMDFLIGKGFEIDLVRGVVEKEKRL